MRAMILAAGLGTRLRPLTLIEPKPALPVAGRPVIAYLIALLFRHGVREVVVNRSYLADRLTAAIAAHTPDGMRVRYSDEPEPLGTGGGVRRAAEFLSGSDPSIVLAGDMIFDADLSALARRHLETGRKATLVLRDDPRAGTFGTIGLDAAGDLRRIATRFDLGGETRAGVFTGVRLFSPGIFEDWPDGAAFEDLGDWLAPKVARGERGIGGVVLSEADSVWEPVGTPEEYLKANLEPLSLSYAADLPRIPPHPAARTDLIVGEGARIAEPGLLRRCVVWAGESVGANVRGESGVFAGGEFLRCDDDEGESIDG
jgi:NDP-sugar pyrophosphorylase family protein